MKLHRLTIAEFFKAIKRQGIIGMIAVLAIMLTVCALIYRPIPKDDFRIFISKTTTAEMLGEFNENPIYKQYYENALAEELSKISFYLNYSTDQKAQLSSRVEEIKFSILGLGQIIEADVFVRSEAKEIVLTLRSQLTNLNQQMLEYFNPDYIVSYADAQKELESRNLINSVIDLIPATISDNASKTWFEATRNSIRNKELHAKLIYFINSISPLEYSVENITDIQTSLLGFQAGWKQTILTEISDYMVNYPASIIDSEKQQLNKLFTNYAAAMRTAIQFAKKAVIIELAGTKSDSQLQQYVGFENYNSYVAATEYEKENFYLQNKYFSFNAQDTVPFNTASSFALNAFDFAFFATEVTSAVVLIFSVFFVSGMIAGEQTNGTMKMLAIRPYSRSKILRSKFRAAMAITIFTLAFTFVASLGIGIYYFGLSLSPYMVVFNASNAMLLSPILLSLIFLASITIKVMVYIAIAVLLSVITRSTAATAVVSLLSFILVLILNASLHVFPFYAFFPFAGFDLFKFFGGGAVASSVNTGLLSLFSTPILNNSNFYYSLAMTLGVIFLTMFYSKKLFKKKDIT